MKRNFTKKDQTIRESALPEEGEMELIANLLLDLGKILRSRDGMPRDTILVEIQVKYPYITQAIFDDLLAFVEAYDKHEARLSTETMRKLYAAIILSHSRSKN